MDINHATVNDESSSDGSLFTYDWESDYDVWCDRLELEQPEVIRNLQEYLQGDDETSDLANNVAADESSTNHARGSAEGRKRPASDTDSSSTVNGEDDDGDIDDQPTPTTSANASPSKKRKKQRRKKRKLKLKVKTEKKQQQQATASAETVSQQQQQPKRRGRPPLKRPYQDLDAAVDSLAAPPGGRPLRPYHNFDAAEAAVAPPGEKNIDPFVAKHAQNFPPQQPLPRKGDLRIFGDRRSVLNEKQHEIYNACRLNLKKSGTLKNTNSKEKQEEHKRWTEKLKDEHKSYNEILKNQMTKPNSLWMNRFQRKIPIRFKIYVEQALQRKKHNFDGFPNKFEFLSDIDIDFSSDSRKACLELNKSNMITVPGKLNHLVMPDLRKACYLADPNYSFEQKTNFVHEDIQNSQQIEDYSPDFVLSFSSALAVLSLIGPAGSKEWQLPVIVKTKIINGRHKKVVYLSKPYPPDKLNKQQYMWYHAKCAMVNYFYPSCRTTSTNVAVASASTNVSSSDEQQQSKVAKTDKSVGNKKKYSQYSMWNVKEYTVVIRSNVYGSWKSSDKKVKKLETFLPASMLPKIEYQWEYGAEELSLDETLRHYWTNYLKLSSVHLIVRLHPTIDCVLAIEELDGDQFRKLDKLKSEIQTAIGEGHIRMTQILEKLANLNNGDYLLCSKGNMEPLKLYRSNVDESKCDLDMSTIYDGVWFRDENWVDFSSLWLPIDPDVHLQWHRIKKRIPATFDPLPESSTSIANERKPSFTGGKRGRRKL